MAKVRRMFTGGNTANGFHSLHDNIMGPGRNKLYILKGMPGGGKSSLMRYIGEKVLDKGYDIEFHHCPSDPNSIDGVVITELGIGIVDGTAPHMIDPIYPGLTDRLIDLAQFIDREKLYKAKEEIIRVKKNNKKAYGKAFAYFKSAKIVYDIIVENNKLGVDFKGVDKDTRILIDEIFSKKAENREELSFKERHLFSNANTPDGFTDYTGTILEGMETNYYIEGEIGTGKSTLLKRLIEECKIRDYNMEIYHNSTIPERIESLIIKDINTCITSNSNGLENAYKIVKLNKYFDERIMDKKDYEAYELLINQATFNLSNARKNHQILEKTYKPTVDYNGVNETRERILKEILEYID